MERKVIRHNERVIQDPAIMVGKPVVQGTRIPVEVVLGALARDFDLNELFAAYPHLTVEDVKAVMDYARQVVESRYRRSEMRRRTMNAARSRGSAASLS
jgi:uncharacterized protein (DUF433 family)